MAETNGINNARLSVAETKVDQLIEQQSNLIELLNEFFKPGGICESARMCIVKNEERLSQLYVRNKAFYWLFAIMIGTIIAGYFVK